MTTIAVVAFVSLISGLAAGYGTGRHQLYALQNNGEALASRAIDKEFPAPDYHLINNPTLPVDDGTTQVDHVPISRFEILFIESKDDRGAIDGDLKSPTWTQEFFTREFTFQDPIFQKTIVSFALCGNRMQFCVGRLAHMRLALTRNGCRARRKPSAKVRRCGIWFLAHARKWERVILFCYGTRGSRISDNPSTDAAFWRFMPGTPRQMACPGLDPGAIYAFRRSIAGRPATIPSRCLIRWQVATSRAG